MNAVIEEASLADSGQIALLVNHAYRPSGTEQGWTHEATLVAGYRIHADQVRALFSLTSTILVMRVNQGIVACVHIEQHGSACHIGMLATLPIMQGSGLGKQMLEAAEAISVQRYQAQTFNMRVLSSRPELLAYYLRRGYQRTGNVLPYPVEAQVGVPILADLHVLELCKPAGHLVTL